MAITTPEELLELLDKSQLLDAEQFREARAAFRSDDSPGTLAARLVQAELLTEQQAAQLAAGRSDFGQPQAKMPPKRRANPPPPKMAQALPLEADEESDGDREAVAEKSGFLQTPQQKILAAAAAATALAVIVLTAILISRLLRSPVAEVAEQDPRIAPAPVEGEPLTDTEEPSSPPATAEPAPAPAPSESPSLDYGFAGNQNPMNVDLGNWHKTETFPSKNQDVKFFPEDGVDLQAKDPDGKPLWQEVPDYFEGMPNMLPSISNATTYFFRTITATKPTTLHAGFGCDDTLDVWLNGKNVHRINDYRSFEIPERVYVRLNVGENELLLKVRNGGGDYGFCFDGHLMEARETAPGEVSAAENQLAAQTSTTEQPATTPEALADASTTNESAPAEAAPAEAAPAESDPPAAAEPLTTAGNLAMLNLDETSGKFFDLSGKNHHGVIEGNVVRDGSGKHRGALRFNGGEGRVILGKPSDFNFGSDFTWTAWIKTGTDGAIMAFTKRGGGWTRGGKVMFVRDGRVAFDSHAAGWFQTNNTVTDNQWHHVALVVKADANGENDDATFYVDGKADARKTDFNIAKFPEEGDFAMKIGYCCKDFWQGQCNGMIDDVTIWNRPLSETEIAATMQAQANPFELLAGTGKLEPYGKAAMPPNFHELGKLSLGPDADVNLFLVGGRKALPLPRYFQIEQGENDNRWLIYLCTPTRGGEPVKTPVAQIALQQQKLLFQWAKGVPSAKANALFNCGLDISVDGRTFFLPFGRPLEVKPVVANLQTGAARNILSGDSLPPPESLRLQVVRVEGFPKPTFNPGDTLTPGEATDISFDPETFPKLWLHVAFDIKVRPTVEVTTKIDYEIENTVFRTFKLSEATQLMNAHQMERRKLIMEMQRVPRNDLNKIKDYANKIKKVETEKMAKLMRLFEVCKTLQEKPGKIQFRIYTVIDDDHELTLMQSFPLEKPAAEK